MNPSCSKKKDTHCKPPPRENYSTSERRSLHLSRKLGLGLEGCGVFSCGGHGTLGTGVAALQAVDNVASDFDVVILEILVSHPFV